MFDPMGANIYVDTAESDFKDGPEGRGYSHRQILTLFARSPLTLDSDRVSCDSRLTLKA